ncbi:hypothetical protein SAMN05216284_102283 [Micromonospora sediminimaris]|nr:hypothetical protein SAMN05216284_102283 [Micromonospora sediminimaris]
MVRPGVRSKTDTNPDGKPDPRTGAKPRTVTTTGYSGGRKHGKQQRNSLSRRSPTPTKHGIGWKHGDRPTDAQQRTRGTGSGSPPRPGGQSGRALPPLWSCQETSRPRGRVDGYATEPRRVTLTATHGRRTSARSAFRPIRSGPGPRARRKQGRRRTRQPPTGRPRRRTGSTSREKILHGGPPVTQNPFDRPPSPDPRTTGDAPKERHHIGRTNPAGRPSNGRVHPSTPPPAAPCQPDTPAVDHDGAGPSRTRQHGLTRIGLRQHKFPAITGEKSLKGSGPYLMICDVSPAGPCAWSEAEGHRTTVAGPARSRRNTRGEAVGSVA